jgi:hypothetical protein
MPDEICTFCGFAGDIHATHCPEFACALAVEPGASPARREGGADAAGEALAQDEEPLRRGARAGRRHHYWLQPRQLFRSSPGRRAGAAAEATK